MLTHCRACGIYKSEYALDKCKGCSGYFCGLHYLLLEDLCDECAGYTYPEDSDDVIPRRDI